MIAAGAALAALIVVIAVQWKVILDLLRDQRLRDDAWASERHALMTRVQAPELARHGGVREPLPSERAAEPLPVNEVEPDESYAVGTII